MLGAQTVAPCLAYTLVFKSTEFMAIIKGEEGLRVEILYRSGALGSAPQVKEERERERGVGRTIN